MLNSALPALSRSVTSTVERIDSGGARLDTRYRRSYGIGLSSRRVTLLAVDDDPSSLELIVEALKREPLDILTSEDPEAAVGLVREKRPEIVLVDLMMPKLSGLEVLDKIMEIEQRFLRK